MESAKNEIRCGQCNKLLAKGWAKEAHIVYKCQRCWAFNTLRATRPSSEPQDGHSEPSHA